MSEERKKKSEAAWKAEEDKELNKSRAFVELTEYVANAVEHDTHFFVLAKLHKLYSLHTKAHTKGDFAFVYTVVISISNLIAISRQSSFLNCSKLSRSFL